MIWVGPQSNDKCPHETEKTRREGKVCEDRRRGWTDVATRQGTGSWKPDTAGGRLPSTPRRKHGPAIPGFWTSGLLSCDFRCFKTPSLWNLTTAAPEANAMLQRAASPETRGNEDSTSGQEPRGQRETRGAQGAADTPVRKEPEVVRGLMEQLIDYF